MKRFALLVFFVILLAINVNALDLDGIEDCSEYATIWTETFPYFADVGFDFEFEFEMDRTASGHNYYPIDVVSLILHGEYVEYRESFFEPTYNLVSGRRCSYITGDSCTRQEGLVTYTDYEDAVQENIYLGFAKDMWEDVFLEIPLEPTEFTTTLLFYKSSLSDRPYCKQSYESSLLPLDKGWSNLVTTTLYNEEPVVFDWDSGFADGDGVLATIATDKNDPLDGIFFIAWDDLTEDSLIDYDGFDPYFPEQDYVFLTESSGKTCDEFGDACGFAWEHDDGAYIYYTLLMDDDHYYQMGFSEPSRLPFTQIYEIWSHYDDDSGDYYVTAATIEHQRSQDLSLFVEPGTTVGEEILVLGQGNFYSRYSYHRVSEELRVVEPSKQDNCFIDDGYSGDWIVICDEPGDITLELTVNKGLDDEESSRTIVTIFPVPPADEFDFEDPFFDEFTYLFSCDQIDCPFGEVCEFGQCVLAHSGCEIDTRGAYSNFVLATCVDSTGEYTEDFVSQDVEGDFYLDQIAPTHRRVVSCHNSCQYQYRELTDDDKELFFILHGVGFEEEEVGGEPVGILDELISHLEFYTDKMYPMGTSTQSITQNYAHEIASFVEGDSSVVIKNADDVSFWEYTYLNPSMIDKLPLRSDSFVPAPGGKMQMGSLMGYTQNIFPGFCDRKSSDFAYIDIPIRPGFDSVTALELCTLPDQTRVYTLSIGAHRQSGLRFSHEFDSYYVIVRPDHSRYDFDAIFEDAIYNALAQDLLSEHEYMLLAVDQEYFPPRDKGDHTDLELKSLEIFERVSPHIGLISDNSYPGSFEEAHAAFHDEVVGLLEVLPDLIDSDQYISYSDYQPDNWDPLTGNIDRSYSLKSYVEQVLEKNYESFLSQSIQVYSEEMLSFNHQVWTGVNQYGELYIAPILKYVNIQSSTDSHSFEEHYASAIFLIKDCPEEGCPYGQIASEVGSSDSVETTQEPTPNFVPDQLIIKFNEDNVGFDELSELNTEFGAIGMERIFPDVKQQALTKTAVDDFNFQRAHIIKFDEGVDIELAALEYNDHFLVEYAELNFVGELSAEPIDSQLLEWSTWTDQAGVMRLGSAWDVTTGDEDIVIAIIDTGVNYFHRGIAPKLWVNDAEDVNNNGVFDPDDIFSNGDFDYEDNDGNGYTDDVSGFSFVSVKDRYREQNTLDISGESKFYGAIGGEPMDTMGHGTKMALTAAGHAYGSEWRSSTRYGACPSCSIMPIKVSYNVGRGYRFGVTGDSISQGMKYAVDNGADILSMSIAITPHFDQELHTMRLMREVSEYADRQGVVQVTAAGNDNRQIRLSYPSSFDWVITVGGIRRDLIDRSIIERWAESPRHASNWGREVDISAPATYETPDAYDDSPNLEDYSSGTSVGTAAVSGIVGLILSAHPDIPKEVRPEFVRQLLAQGATPFPDTITHELGAGVVNAENAVKLLDSDGVAFNSQITTDEIQVECTQPPTNAFGKVTVFFQTVAANIGFGEQINPCTTEQDNSFVDSTGESFGLQIINAQNVLDEDGITTERKIAYIPGVSESIYVGVEPRSFQIDYDDLNELIQKAISFVREGRVTSTNVREDAWRFYLGLPQLHETFKVSSFQPSTEENQEYDSYGEFRNYEGYYYALPHFEHLFKQGNVFFRTSRFNRPPFFVSAREGRESDAFKEIISHMDQLDIQKASAFDNVVVGYDEDISYAAGVMGEFTIMKGADDYGVYLSYYDNWNLDEIFVEGDEGLFGSPYQIYGRLYYDPETYEIIDEPTIQTLASCRHGNALGKPTSGNPCNVNSFNQIIETLKSLDLSVNEANSKYHEESSNIVIFLENNHNIQQAHDTEKLFERMLPVLPITAVGLEGIPNTYSQEDIRDATSLFEDARTEVRNDGRIVAYGGDNTFDNTYLIDGMEIPHFTYLLGRISHGLEGERRSNGLQSRLYNMVPDQDEVWRSATRIESVLGPRGDIFEPITSSYKQSILPLFVSPGLQLFFELGQHNQKFFGLEVESEYVDGVDAALVPFYLDGREEVDLALESIHTIRRAIDDPYILSELQYFEGEFLKMRQIIQSKLDEVQLRQDTLPNSYFVSLSEALKIYDSILQDVAVIPRSKTWARIFEENYGDQPGIYFIIGGESHKDSFLEELAKNKQSVIVLNKLETGQFD